jgi:hypothetical protein
MAGKLDLISNHARRQYVGERKSSVESFDRHKSFQRHDPMAGHYRLILKQQASAKRIYGASANELVPDEEVLALLHQMRRRGGFARAQRLMVKDV